MLKIALDYDGTFSADPAFWVDFIENARKAGHEVRIVTFRSEEHDWCDHFDELSSWMGVTIHCTDGKAKKYFCSTIGWIPDIWIDDKPETVYDDSAMAEGSPELLAWRKEQQEKRENEKAFDVV